MASMKMQPDSIAYNALFLRPVFSGLSRGTITDYMLDAVYDVLCMIYHIHVYTAKIMYFEILKYTFPACTMQNPQK